MKKKEAKELLGLSNKELSGALHISESYIRNSNEFSDAISSHIRALAKIDELQADIDRHLKTIDRVSRALDN